VLGGQGDRREHRLVTELGEEERHRRGEDGRPGGPLGLGPLSRGEPVAAQGPRAEPDERDGGHQRDPAGRQRTAEAVPDGDGEQVHRRGGKSDADEHRQRPVAGGEREGHQLGLVAQLGDEHHAEADRERKQKTVHIAVDGTSGWRSGWTAKSA
jgi:hypothetical protein